MSIKTTFLTLGLLVVFTVSIVGFSLLKPFEQRNSVNEGTSDRADNLSENEENFDWKAYEGTRIRVIFVKHPWVNVIQNHLGEFEKLTGIKVILDTLPEQQARQKLVIVLAAGGQDVDAYMTAIHNEHLLYHQSEWYTDLRKFLDNPKLTSRDYDFKDFYEATRNLGVQPDGSVTSIPFTVNPMMFMPVLNPRKL
jgi:ABC-type glycerol-3-phosphate transport system substrate-binding protein